MRKLRKCSVLIFLTSVVLYSTAFAQSRDESEVYNQMATIKGHVEILNNPEIGKTAGTGIFIVFQRVDCRKCLVGIFADVNGDYRVRVGQGKYKVIVYNPSPPTYDMLAPDQPRFVTANSIIVDTVFDINLVMRTDKK